MTSIGFHFFFEKLSCFIFFTLRLSFDFLDSSVILKHGTEGLATLVSPELLMVFCLLENDFFKRCVVF